MLIASIQSLRVSDENNSCNDTTETYSKSKIDISVAFTPRSRRRDDVPLNRNKFLAHATVIGTCTMLEETLNQTEAPDSL